MNTKVHTEGAAMKSSGRWLLAFLICPLEAQNNDVFSSSLKPPRLPKDNQKKYFLFICQLSWVFHHSDVKLTSSFTVCFFLTFLFFYNSAAQKPLPWNSQLPTSTFFLKSNKMLFLWNSSGFLHHHPDHQKEFPQ